MLPPGLNRAISDSTSPFGAYPPAEVLRNLEVYLADSRSTDAVYQGLVNRACAQTISIQLVERVVALLKTYILRYTPSQDILQLLDDFCFRAQEVAGLSDSGQRAVQYVRSCLRKLRSDRSGAGRSFRGSYGSLTGNSSSTGSLRALLGRSKEDLSRLGPDGRFSSVKISVGSTSVGRGNDRYASADALPSPTDPDAALSGTAALPAFLRMSASKGGRGWEDLRVPAGAQVGFSMEPGWAVPSRPAQLPAAPAGATTLRARYWLQHLPDLAPRVTLAATVPGGSQGAALGSFAPALASLSLSGAPPINLATIHRCVLDLDDQDIGRHLAEVLGEARAEAEQSQPTTSQRQTSRGPARGAGGGGAGARDAGKGRRGRPARLLFHHPPYNRAEQLPMTEADIAVVVEAVCGVRAANALSAVQGPPAPAEDAAAAALLVQAEGMWQAAFEEDGEFAQMCGSILMKLIMDLWIRAPVGSYMLTLRMLRSALRSDQPSTRARALDVVYNLSLHGAMLRSEAEEVALAAAANEMGNGVPGARNVQMPWQVCASAPVSPFMSGGGGGAGGMTPPPASRPTGPAPSTPSPAPPTSTTTAATPAAPSAGGGGSAAAHHVPSHSLGLMGSAVLDMGGSLTGMASGQPGPRGSLKAAQGSAGEAAAAAAGTRRDTAAEGPRLAGSTATPVASPAAKVPALGAAAGGAGGSGVSDGGPPVGYDRWLRAVLFQLLCDLCEAREYSEEVWRAAMGCVAQLCSHGGFWVAAWVQHLPPAAVSGLLRAASSLNWSQELYAHLLQLVPHVLIRTTSGPAGTASSHSQQQQQQTPTSASKRPESAFAAPTAVGPAAAAAADDAAASAATTAVAEAAELAERLGSFGGLDELLFHFRRAPTPDSRAALLTAMAYCCGGPGSEQGGSGSLSSSGERLSGGRSPRTSTSPAGRGQEAGPATMLAALQGLHLDSVCLALRAALQRPWQGMSSRLADVLASACAISDVPAAGYNGATPSPSASVSGSADYAAHSLPAGVASPIAVRALLRPLLEALECSCAESMAAPQVGERRAYIELSVAHVLSSSGGAGQATPPLTASNVTAAWQSFKETCSEGCPESRQLSIHWLHQLLSAACRTCQGQIPLLSPLSLKASQETGKAAGAVHAPGHASPPLPQWNVALADALLNVVREAPLGCELLMAAISRVAADQKALLTAAESPLSPRFGGLAAAPHAAGTGVPRVTGEEPALAACRRVMWLYYVGLQWMLQCGSPDSRMPAAVELADTVLAALLQPDPALQAAAAGAATAPGDRAAAGGVASTRGSNASLLGAGASRVGGASGGMLSQHAPQSQQQLQLGSTPPGAVAPAAPSQEFGGGMLISQQLLSGLLALDPDALACTPPELLVTLLQQCSQSLHDAGAGLTVAAGNAKSGNQNGGLRDSKDTTDGGSGGDEAGGGGFRGMHRGFIGRPCCVVGAGTAPSVSSSASAGPAAAAAGGGRLGTASVRVSALSAGGSGGGEPSLSGAAVGPWQDDWQDRRLALLLLLMARCSLDPEAFARYSLSHVIKAQLGCGDLRCRYYAGVYLLKHWMLNQHDKYWRTLRHIIGTAQQLNDERLLDNPYLQMRTMLNVDHA